MRAGALRERIDIEQEVRTDDDGGGYALAWSAVASNVSAQVEPVSGRERLQAQQLEGMTDYRVTIRWRSGITAGMRVVWGSVVMAIVAPPRNPDMKRRFLELDCREGGAV